MQSIQQFTQTHYWAVRDYLAPVLRESKFKEHGRITPEEFVAAGDFLCYKFPTWSWESGDASKKRDFLPDGRQYLISRNVPCLRRASQMVYTDADEDAETMVSFAAEGAVKDYDDEDWAVTHTTRTSQTASANIGDIPDADAHPGAPGLTSATAGLSISDDAPDEEAIPDIDDIPDMDEEYEGGGVVEEEDEAAVKKVEPKAGAGAVEVGQTNPSNLMNVRTYDCLITYDKYYQTPRMWLQGYSPSRAALTPQEVFSDVSPDYAQKTVTIEPFPHLNGISLASVHPCKHASVMRKVIERMDTGVREAQKQAAEGGKMVGKASPEKEKKKWGIGAAVKKATGNSKKALSAATGTGSPMAEAEGTNMEGLRVDQYLLVFLKFISSVVPTIEIDSTTSVSLL